MIIGAHSILYSKSPDEDRAFLRNVMGLPSVDVGDGWLIFGLPPSEVAVHPSTRNDLHELYFMCEDVEKFVETMERREVRCEPVQDAGWGRLTYLILPGGGRLGIYEPRHARPKPMSVGKAENKGTRKTQRRKTTKTKPRRGKRKSTL